MQKPTDDLPEDTLTTKKMETIEIPPEQVTSFLLIVRIAQEVRAFAAEDAKRQEKMKNSPALKAINVY